MGLDMDKMQIDPENILNNLNAGIYIVSPDRKILYWGSAAQKITGWTGDEVVGTRCCDGILCHIDKDGHELCSEGLLSASPRDCHRQKQ